MAERVARVVRVMVVGVLIGVVGVTLAGAQARDARVVVTVTDPTGGVIPGATVTVTGLEAATNVNAPAPAKTGEKGTATVDRLAPGRYRIQAEFAGFEIGIVPDIRLRAGENTRVIVLPLKGMQDAVTVGGGQEGAASRTNPAAFGVALSSDQIDALSDDPNELQQQINDLGGPDAIVRVDSFEGQQLPPKAQIKSIHVTRDQFAAETEQPGSTFVDIITQPGVGSVHGGVNTSYHDGAWNGQNPFLAAGTRTPEQQRRYGGNLAGSIARDKADFSVSINGVDNYVNPILNANAITGAPAQVLAVKQGEKYVFGNALVNYALTRDQTLRIGYNQGFYDDRNEGVGTYTDLDGAVTEHYTSAGFRVQEAGPIGRRVFVNTRLNVSWNDDTYHSAVEAPTIVVLDTATMGGAQQAGGTHQRNLTLASDVDYVRGIHSWRAGFIVYSNWYRTDQRNNYLGTYTFNSVDAYRAGTPTLFTIERGDPSFSYFNAQGGAYVQDDIRVHKGLTLSPGVRFSAQTRIDDPRAFEPRFGITWAPWASGKTTLRASAGTFHGWLPTYVLAQTIRLDGAHQQQIIVNDPAYDPDHPDFSAGIETPPTKYELGPYQLQRNVRYSAGVDHAFSPKVRVSVLYNYVHQEQLPRGLNLNPLVDGARVDPAYGSIVETVTDAQIVRHEVYTTFNVNLAPGQAASAALFNWRRLAINGGYSWIHPRRNADGPFDVPPSGTLDTEWGPGPADARYRVNMTITSTQIRNVVANLSVLAVDGQVYTEYTGFDDNGDGFLNDRPAGVGLRSLRQAGQLTLSARVAYNFNLGGSTGGSTGAPGAQARYRTSAYVSVANLTNHANYVGYSGTLTSSNFMQPTGVANPRRIDMGVNVNF